ncbi:MAG: M20/M25/M40 family metallo-hydrolase [Pseudomonadota bacterium]
MNLADLTLELMAVPGLSGHEHRIRAAIRDRLSEDAQTDILGNLWETRPGRGPVLMLFTHMDQLGFVVRRIEADGYLRLERVGGVPEKALASQSVLVTPDGVPDIPGIIANKSHHATQPEEKYTVTPYRYLFVDCGFEDRAEAEAAGIGIGTPVVYAPGGARVGPHRLVGPSVDDRAGCAVLIAVADALRDGTGATVHTAFTVQEEFNLRGALPLAQHLQPDIAIQVDLMLATDTPDMADLGEMRLGGGPGISLLSFHGRGTLNGVIPHPRLVRLFNETAEAKAIPLQRSAQTGVLTDLSYVQLVGSGVAALDVGFPMRYSHSSREMVDLRDLAQLRDLLIATIAQIGPDFSLERVP